jgi:large subunit ribosomal protein L13
MKTSIVKPKAAQWYLVDAGGQALGRLAVRVATVLNGKHKASWSPHQLQSDHVIVINAEKLVLAGRKAEQKEYFRHSGHFGHLQRIPFARLFAKDPTRVFELAVSGMLQRNRLRKCKLKHLHVFAGSDHPHEPQKPEPLEHAFSPPHA